MRDLAEFEKERIVRARMAGVAFAKTAELLGFSRSTISKTMTKFKKHGKTSVTVWASRLTDRDRRALKRIVGRKHRSTANKMTVKLNQHLNSPNLI